MPGVACWQQQLHRQAHPFTARQGAMGACLHWAGASGGVVSQAAVAAHHPGSLLVAQPAAMRRQHSCQSHITAVSSHAMLWHRPVLLLPAVPVLLKSCTVTLSHKFPCMCKTDHRWAVGAYTARAQLGSPLEHCQCTSTTQVSMLQQSVLAAFVSSKQTGQSLAAYAGCPAEQAWQHPSANAIDQPPSGRKLTLFQQQQ